MDAHRYSLPAIGVVGRGDGDLVDAAQVLALHFHFKGLARAPAEGEHFRHVRERAGVQAVEEARATALLEVGDRNRIFAVRRQLGREDSVGAALVISDPGECFTRRVAERQDGAKLGTELGSHGLEDQLLAGPAPKLKSVDAAGGPESADQRRRQRDGLGFFAGHFFRFDFRQLADIERDQVGAAERSLNSEPMNPRLGVFSDRHFDFCLLLHALRHFRAQIHARPDDPLFFR